MLTNIISLILCSIISFIGIRFKPIYGISIIIFLIPMSNRLVSVGEIRISFVALMIFCFFFGYLTKKRFVLFDVNNVRYKKYVLLITLCLLITTPIALISGLPNNIEILDKNIINNLTVYLFTSIAAIIFFVIIQMETKTFEQIQSYIKVFVSTVYFLVAIFFLINVLSINLPAFITPIAIEDIAGEQNALTLDELDIHGETLFTGYTGFVENFAEYLFVLFVFGFILLADSGCHKLYRIAGAMCCILSIAFSIPNAVKAYPIMLGLFLFLIFIFSRNRFVRASAFIIITVIGLLLLYFVTYLPELFFSQRMYVMVERYDMIGHSFNISAIELLLGRPYLISIINDIIETGGIFGIGPLVVWSIEGSSIPYHNLYYALYLNFGFIGFIIFMALFVSIFADLVKSYKIARPNLKITAMSFLFLYIILLIGQIKVSSFRISSGILMYWFLFALFASLSNLIVKESNVDKKN